MIVSNEPGYYKTDAYGIRIENLVAVREASFSNDAEREMLCFETLTLAPIDINLVVAELLSEAEKDWLDAYHRRVYEALADVLDDQERDWLETATAPVQ